MGKRCYGTNEIAARGREIYETKLRQQLEPDDIGKYVVIDIETEEYEIDEDGDTASLRARNKNPDGARYGMRVGYRAWGRIGLGGAKSAS